MVQEGEGGHRQLNRTEQELGPGLDLVNTCLKVLTKLLITNLND